MFKSGKKIWYGHVAHMRGKNCIKSFNRKTSAKRSLIRNVGRWDDNINVYIKETT
jgi:hypothetical protein